MKRIYLLFTLLISLQAVAQDCPEITNKKALKLYDQAIDKYKSKATYRDLLEEAVNVEPDFAVAYDSLGRSWYYINKTLNFSGDSYKRAEKYFRQAVEVCPDVDPFAYYVIGRMDMYNSQFGNAAANFRKFLSYEKRKDKEFKLNDNDLDSAEIFLKDCDFYDNVYKKPVPFSPVPVPNISTSVDEYLGSLTPDNEIMYFTRRTMEASLNSLTGPVQKERFCKSVAQADGSFDKGKPMLHPFNQPGNNEGGPSSTIDNNTLYFTICRDEAGYRNCDIFYSVFSNNEWGDITKLDGVNLPDYWESQPSVSSDGNTIYFASDRPGGQGGIDIYKTVKGADGKWGKPINAGATINTDLDDKSPFFHTDGQTLYFSSEGHQNLGGFDIFFSKLDTTGKFLPPKNIGYPINTDKDDLGFFCSTDGKTGYFASDRHKGVGGYDIMGFDLYAAARPEKVLFVKGTLKDDAGKPVKNATVEIKNIDTKQITKVQVDTTTGRYVTAVALKSDYILTVKQPGTAFTSQFFSKADTATAKPRKVDLEVAPIKTGKAYTLNNINFPTNSFELPAQSKLVVDEFAIFLQENPSMKVAIQGHTDDVGNDANNMVLSDNRAKAVYDYLVSKGIDSSRLSSKGFGETKPLVPNASEPNRAKNRRTEFVIVAK